MSPPDRDTYAYEWWKKGTEDEHKCHNEGLSDRHIEARGLLEGLARRRPEEPPDVLIIRVAWIYMANLPLRRRLKHAWRLIRK